MCSCIALCRVEGEELVRSCIPLVIVPLIELPPEPPEAMLTKGDAKLMGGICWTS